jgi:uncharacterized protein YegP (UPF0339 family)
MWGRKIGIASSVVLAVLLQLAPSLARAADKNPVTFEMFQDKSKEYRWRLKQGDDIIGMAGQGFKSKASCRKSIEAIKKGLGNDKDKFEIYEDNAKAFRWRLKATNGQIVAAANKGFKNKADCQKVIDLIKKEAQKATIAEEKK